GCFVLEPARSDPARPHAPDLLRADQPGVFEHPHVLLHACEGHIELGSEIADGGAAAPEPLEDAPASCIRERSESRVEPQLILNHMVQYRPTKLETQAERGVKENPSGADWVVISMGEPDRRI